MTEPRLYVFDDARARGWAPFTLTRPVGELLFGTRTLRARAESVLGLPCAGHLSRASLVGFDEPGAPPVIAPGEVPIDHPRILLSSRLALDPGERPRADEPGRLVLDGSTVGWVLPTGAPMPPEEHLRDPAAVPDGGPEHLVRGTLLGRPWDLVASNPERVAADVESWPGGGEARGVHLIGGGRLSVAEGAAVEPGVHVDTRAGPVILEAGARVEAPARLVGPLFVGAGTTVLGGVVGSSTIGPRCKVRGEIAQSVFLAFSNKAHDGHLGHALVGRWVNLGAMTTNSDLKNNYGSVRVWTLEGEVDSGLTKVGCFLGDHVKTGIGTMLGTGTVVGAGSNLFGSAVPPKAVPPFSWGSGAELTAHELDRFLVTAERAMARRDQALTPGVRRILEEAWRASAPLRG